MVKILHPSYCPEVVGFSMVCFRQVPELLHPRHQGRPQAQRRRSRYKDVADAQTHVNFQLELSMGKHEREQCKDSAYLTGLAQILCAPRIGGLAKLSLSAEAPSLLGYDRYRRHESPLQYTRGNLRNGAENTKAQIAVPTQDARSTISTEAGPKRAVA